MSADLTWAIREALSCTGREPGALVWETGVAPSFAELTRRLNGLGLDARMVELRAADLKFLTEPALLWRSDNRPARLLMVSRGQLTIGLPFGETREVPFYQFAAEFTGEALLLHTGESKRTSLLGLASEALGKKARLLWGMLVLMFLTSLLGLLTPWLTELLFDDILNSSANATLSAVALCLLLVSIFQSAFHWLGERLLLGLESALRHVNTQAVFEASLRAPYLFLRQEGLGGIQQRVQSAETAATLLAGLIVQAMELTMAGMYAVALVIRSPILGLSAAVIAVVCFVCAAFFAQRQAVLERRLVNLDATAEGRLHGLLVGLETFRSQGNSSTPLGGWFRSHLSSRLTNLRRQRNDLLLNLWIEGSQHAIVFGALLWSAVAVQADEGTVGELMGNGVLASALASAVARAARVIVPTWSLRLHRTRGDEVLSLATRAPVTGPMGTFKVPSEPLSVDNVWCRYGDGRPWVLENVSLGLRRGEFRDLHGPSGSGKSTLLRLMAGLIEPDRGEVRLLGTNPGQQNGANVFYLPQGATLFEGTIASNIELFSGAEPERILRAAEQTGLTEWLQELPMGLSTRISSRGGNVSGGQRQLIFLTAAVASKAPVILLDEAVSHLDAARKATLNLRRLFDGRTVVHATHEVSSELVGDA